MDILATVKEKLMAVIAQVAGEQADLSAVRFSIPPEKMNADVATNAALVLAKPLGRAPAELAGEMAVAMSRLDCVVAVTTAGPFINVTITPQMWAEFACTLASGKTDFGQGKARGQKVLLEFISANPTGPLHVGHARGAILGLALSRLLAKAGYQVTTEYYINDYGVQIKTLLFSVRWRYQQLCRPDEKIEPPAGAYPGEYLVPVAQAIFDEYGDKLAGESEEEFYRQLKERVVAAMMETIRSDLASLGLVFDNFVSETALVQAGAIKQTLAQLAGQTVTVATDEGEQTLPWLYRGRLSKPQGGPANEQEEEASRHDEGEQLIFRSSADGDDRDRVVARADGSTTYFASDIAYHADKIRRGFDQLINLFGADHAGYVARLQAAVRALSGDRVSLEVLLMRLVALEKDGVPFKMSKRAGNFVLLRDVVAAVDVDELKLFMLSKSADTPTTFDLVRIKEKSKDNVVYYIQYAVARTYSLSDKFAAVFGQNCEPAAADAECLVAMSNLAVAKILRQVARYPEVIKQAAIKRAPNLLVEYLHQLASLWHSLWGQDAQLVDEADVASSRSWQLLDRVVQRVLVDGLATLGVTAKQKL
ncbi:arginine--tRNA ligase [bacterium]|nr:arginine--tRNA ligase [bacterium]